MARRSTLIWMTITEEVFAMPMKEPVHPGRIVRGALEDIDVTVTDAARALHVSRSALSNLVNCAASISPEMAYRLSMGVGSTPGFWMRLQLNYDLAQVEKRAGSIEVSPLVSERVA
jgi:antitoxin HigA-1